jgi:hypothetical protein
MSHWDTDVSIFTQTNQTQKQIMKLTLQLIVCFFALVSSAHAQKAPVEKQGPLHALGRGIKQAITTPNMDREARAPRQTRREQEEEVEACIPGVCHKNRTVVVRDEVHTHYVRGETKHISFGDPTPKVTEETVLVPQTHHIHYKYAEVETIEGPKLEPINTTETVLVPRTHTVTYEYDEWQTIEGPKLEPINTTETVLVPRTNTVVYAPAPVQTVAQVDCPPVVAAAPRTISIGYVETKSCNWCMQNATVVSGVRVPCACKKAH